MKRQVTLFILGATSISALAAASDGLPYEGERAPAHEPAVESDALADSSSGVADERADIAVRLAEARVAAVPQLRGLLNSVRSGSQIRTGAVHSVSESRVTLEEGMSIPRDIVLFTDGQSASSLVLPRGLGASLFAGARYVVLVSPIDELQIISAVFPVVEGTSEDVLIAGERFSASELSAAIDGIVQETE